MMSCCGNERELGNFYELCGDRKYSMVTRNDGSCGIVRKLSIRAEFFLHIDRFFRLVLWHAS